MEKTFHDESSSLAFCSSEHFFQHFMLQHFTLLSEGAYACLAREIIS